MELQEAIEQAERFVKIFGADCDRIEIVGSCKRQDKPEVHDIELLMILNGRHPRPEFGVKETYATTMDQTIAELRAAHVLREPLKKKANGEKYKKFAICEFSQLNDFCLDLFIVTPQTWGVQNVIRTGPRLFSHSFVTPEGVLYRDKVNGGLYYGLLPHQYRYIRGETKIMKAEGSDEILLSLPEESDAIALLGHGWIEPAKRRQYIRKATA